MNILSVENVSKSYGLKVLFSGVTFGLSQGEKVGLVARNGAGKSSLLRIISGEDNADSGTVSMRKDIKTSFLHQDPQFDPKLNILEAVLSSGSELMRTVREYEECIEELTADPSEKNQERMQDLNNKMDLLQGWDLEQRVSTILGKLGFDHFTHKVSTLSGGQIKRLALAQVLVDEPDLLVLDEPTNHLDIDMIEWLESYLTGRDMTLLLVTHDRYFLDAVSDRIVELEDGKLFRTTAISVTTWRRKQSARNNRLLKLKKQKIFIAANWNGCGKVHVHAVQNRKRVPMRSKVWPNAQKVRRSGKT